MNKRQISGYHQSSLSDVDVVVTRQTGFGGERLRAAIAPVAVMMSAPADIPAITGDDRATRKLPFVLSLSDGWGSAVSG